MQIPIEFRGDGKSYFRIWAVNLFLSLITLGVYSAWAKVRSNRYFYSHLYIDGSCFEYLANPLNILIGRAIAVVLFTTYTLMSRYLPEFSLWFLVVLIPAVPWMLLKSLQFRARNSAFRNIRFRFHGRYPRALLVMGIYPALVLAPLVFVTRWVQPGPEFNQFFVYLTAASCISVVVLGFTLHKYYEYVVSNSSYGTTRFNFKSKVKEYYGLIFRLIFSTMGWLILIIILLTLALALISYTTDATIGGFAFPVLAGVIVSAVYIRAAAMYSAGTTNRLYNGIVIPDWYTFESDVSTWGLFGVYLINTVFIILTLGFYIPFAKIRLIRYRISHLKFDSTQSLDEFVFENDEDVAAIGQEMGELFDVGLSL